MQPPGRSDNDVEADAPLLSIPSLLLLIYHSLLHHVIQCPCFLGEGRGCGISGPENH